MVKERRFWVATTIVSLAAVLVLASCSGSTSSPPAEEAPQATTGENETSDGAVVEPLPIGDYLFDLETGETAALPSSVAGGGYCIHASPDGSRITFHVDNPEKGAIFYVANVDGSDAQVISAKGVPDGAEVRCPDWSPDGTKIVYQTTVQPPKSENLFIYDLTSGETTQISHLKPNRDGGWMNPTFTADGQSVLFHRAGVTGLDLWSVPATGGEPFLVQKDAAYGVASPNGTEIAFVRGVSSYTGSQISMATFGSADPPRTLVEGPDLGWPRVSPDGSKIVYIDSGKVFVMDLSSEQGTRVGDLTVNQFGVADWFDDHTLIIDRY